MVTPKQLENDIKNLNYEQINKIINKSTNKVDIYFLAYICNRVLQLSLKQIIKQKIYQISQDLIGKIESGQR